MPVYCITSRSLGAKPSGHSFLSSKTIDPKSIKDARVHKESKIAVWCAHGELDYNNTDSDKRVIIYKKASLPLQIFDEYDELTMKTAKHLFQRLQDVYDFYLTCFGRRGLDGNNGLMLGYVMWGDDNAVFDGTDGPRGGRMIFGTGKEDEADWVERLDVVGHEATHAVIEHTTNLQYRAQSGALHESLADCFGIMLKQWKFNQRDPKNADWEYGGGAAYPYGEGDRNFKDPTEHGQPWSTDDYDELNGDDNFGVHHNSGILNYAFYLIATWLEKPSWTVLGSIWYKAMTDTENLPDNANFSHFARVTLIHTPEELRYLVEAAWEVVGVPLPVEGDIGQELVVYDGDEGNNEIDKDGTADKTETSTKVIFGQWDLLQNK